MRTRLALTVLLAVASAPSAAAQPADTLVTQEGLTATPPEPAAVEAPEGPQSIQVSPEQSVAGVPALISFDRPAQRVVITYRPNSAIPQTDTLDARGSPFTTVTFRQAGVVRVAIPGGPSTNVSVRFDRTPVGGVVVLVLAGLILFGGAGFAMAMLMRGGSQLDRKAVKRHPDL
jgi:hypothetical protein